jgi:NAD(P)H-hydrate epimerase
MRIVSVSEMQALESNADAKGHSYHQMMEKAGSGLAEAVMRRVSVVNSQILILVGPGNNGGDGLVTARLLKDAGASVTAYLSRPRDIEEDSVFKEAREHGVAMLVANQDENAKNLRRLTRQADVLIDALLGTGAKPPLRGTIAAILRVVIDELRRNQTAKLTPLQRVPPRSPERPFIVAVDGPSGLDFDTGETDESALSAHLTVTFALPKWGHLRLPGAEKVGELIAADIGIPDDVNISEGPEIATSAMVQEWLPSRPLDAHKGTFGKAMIVAGSANYTGAAILSARAALRGGTGLVTLAVASTLHQAIVSAVPEATYLLLPHSLGVLNEHASPVLERELEDYDAMLIGPGLGNTPETEEFLRTLFDFDVKRRSTGFIQTSDREKSKLEKLPALVIDADGLNLLSKIPEWHTRLPMNSVLTPHPGEMARLTERPVGEIQADRLRAATKWSQLWQQVIVLKGAFTVIAAPQRPPVILPFANPGLSSAGTGDVLAGSIVALRAQGLPAFEAAVAGAYLHGLSGEIARDEIGTAGIVAGDVADYLAEAWNRLS